MSSDAKAWCDDDGYIWSGINDADHDAPPFTGDLADVLNHARRRLGAEAMSWEFRTYPDGKIGLVGYVAR